MRDVAAAARVDHLVDDRDRELGEQADRRRHPLEPCPRRTPCAMPRVSASKVISTSPIPRSTKVVVAPRPPVSNTGTLAKSFVDELLHLRLVVAEFLLRLGRRREIGVARVARGLRVREDHLHVVADEIAPVLDALRVARAHHEGRQRIVGRGVVRQSLLPVGCDTKPFVDQELRCRCTWLKVTTSASQALDDGARLLRRAGMRLVDGDILAGVGLVFRREGRVLLAKSSRATS